MGQALRSLFFFGECNLDFQRCLYDDDEHCLIHEGNLTTVVRNKGKMFFQTPKFPQSLRKSSNYIDLFSDHAHALRIGSHLSSIEDRYLGGIYK